MVGTFVVSHLEKLKAHVDGLVGKQNQPFPHPLCPSSDKARGWPPATGQTHSSRVAMHRPTTPALKSSQCTLLVYVSHWTTIKGGSGGCCAVWKPDLNSFQGTHHHTVQWMPIVTQLWMNFNLSWYLVSPW
jgi:hypothetical protein